jgi:S1-C subfamily serine protease
VLVLAVRIASSPASHQPAAAATATLTRSTVTALDRGVVDIDTNLGYQDGAAAGTGMVLSPNGIVLTNNHVIRDATTIRVVVPATHRGYAATVIGYDVSDDVAVLKLKGASGLATISVGNSSVVRRGDRVTAIGNAGGVGGKPSRAHGTITAVGQSITASDGSTSENLRGLLETNARLQPGDSGGALVDSSGHVIGMNTAASTGFYFQTSASQGFAIPINRALSLAKQIIAGQASTSVHIGPTPFLGVDVASADSFPGPVTSGVVVGAVIPSSPAARAGLSAGDVIVSLDGRQVSSPSSLTSLLLRNRPGTKVSVGWIDQLTGSQTATVTLASGPPQ